MELTPQGVHGSDAGGGVTRPGPGQPRKPRTALPATPHLLLRAPPVPGGHRPRFPFAFPQQRWQQLRRRAHVCPGPTGGTAAACTAWQGGAAPSRGPGERREGGEEAAPGMGGRGGSALLLGRAASERRRRP